MRSLTICCAGIVTLLLPLAARGQLRRGDWELTLAGTGVSGSGGGIAAGASAALGYFLTDQFELSLRQQVAYSDIGAPGAFFGQTKFALDFNLALSSQWQSFVGAQAGYQYGDLVSDAFEAGPELGIRYFVNQTTFIFLSGEYEFFFNSSNSDDQFAFALGIGFRF